MPPPQANWFGILHWSHSRSGSSVGLSQKALIPKGVRLLADCAMSYFISLLTASQRKDAPSKSVLQFTRQNNNFAMSLTLRSEIKRVLDNRI